MAAPVVASQPYALSAASIHLNDIETEIVTDGDGQTNEQFKASLYSISEKTVQDNQPVVFLVTLPENTEIDYGELYLSITVPDSTTKKIELSPSYDDPSVVTSVFYDGGFYVPGSDGELITPQSGKYTASVENAAGDKLSGEIWFMMEKMSSPVFSFTGSGTSTDPYLISSADDLVGLRGYVQAGYPFSGVYFKQTQDISLASFDNWEPIGAFRFGISFVDSNHPDEHISGSIRLPFCGIYDGNDCSITDLTSTGKHFSSLFGYINRGAVLKHIHMKDVLITGSGGWYSGALVGGIYDDSGNVLVEDCSVSGLKDGSSVSGSLIGRVYATGDTTTSSVTIKNCYSDLTSGVMNGGLIGVAEDYGDSNIFIVDCHAKLGGDVSAYSGLIGGVHLGEGTIEISRCSAVVSESTSCNSGMIYRVNAQSPGTLSIHDSFSRGYVSFGDYDYDGAGFISYIDTDAYLTDGEYGSVIIKNCYSDMEVTADTESGTAFGFVGQADKCVSVVNCAALNSALIGADKYAITSPSDAAVTNCYYIPLTEVTDSTGSNTVTEATAKTQAFYEGLGWDFATIWSIDEGSTYPYLQESGSVECAHVNQSEKPITVNGISESFPMDNGDGTHYWYVNKVCDDCGAVIESQIKKSAVHKSDSLSKNGVCECNYHTISLGTPETMFAKEDVSVYLVPESTAAYSGGSINANEEVSVLAAGLGAGGEWSLIKYSVTGTDRTKIRFVETDKLAQEESEILPIYKFKYVSDVKSLDDDGNPQEHIREYFARYDDSFFKEPSTTYNHNLAQMSLGLSAASLSMQKDSSYDFLNSAYQTLGYLNSDSINYHEEYILPDEWNDITLNPIFDQPVSYSIHSKSVIDDNGDCWKIYSVVICGDGERGAWMGNVRLGDGEYVEGFEYPATHIKIKLLSEIEKDLDKSSLTDSRVIIWSTGFGRGAAISNLLSAHLNDAADTINWLKKENIYSYNFATMNVVDTSVSGVTDLSQGYENIYNIVDAGDVVTELPLSTWGYEKYGKTYYFNYNGMSNFNGNEIPNLISVKYNYLHLTDGISVPVVNTQVTADYLVYILSNAFESKEKYNNIHYPYLKALLACCYFDGDFNILAPLRFKDKIERTYPWNNAGKNAVSRAESRHGVNVFNKNDNFEALSNLKWYIGTLVPRFMDNPNVPDATNNAVKAEWAALLDYLAPSMNQDDIDFLNMRSTIQSYCSSVASICNVVEFGAQLAGGLNPPYVTKENIQFTMIDLTESLVTEGSSVIDTYSDSGIATLGSCLDSVYTGFGLIITGAEALKDFSLSTGMIYVSLWTKGVELASEVVSNVVDSNNLYNILDGFVAAGYLHNIDGVLDDDECEERSLQELDIYLELFEHMFSLPRHGESLTLIPKQHYIDLYMSWMEIDSSEDILTTMHTSMSEQQTIKINLVCDDELGRVYGDQSVLLGNYVTIGAEGKTDSNGLELMFIGWFTEDNVCLSCDEMYTFKPTRDMVLRAEFGYVYDIVYHLDGGSIDYSVYPAGYYIVSDKDIAIQNPVWDASGNSEYEFLGWTWSGQTTPVKDVIIKAGETGDKEFTAHWKLYVKEGKLSSDNMVYTIPGTPIITITLKTNNDDYAVAVSAQSLGYLSETLLEKIVFTDSTGSKEEFFSFEEYELDIPAEVSNGAEIEFEVPAALLKRYNSAAFGGMAAPRISAKDIALFHHTENGWEKLPTTLIKTTGTGLGEVYHYKAVTSSASPFSIGAVVPKESAAPASSHSSSRNYGSSVWLPATAEPTAAPTAEPTQGTPAATQPVQPTPQASTPAPFIGILAGLGAAGILFTLRRK